jgi:hypothetical protein
MNVSPCCKFYELEQITPTKIEEFGKSPKMYVDNLIYLMYLFKLLCLALSLIKAANLIMFIRLDILILPNNFFGPDFSFFVCKKFSRSINLAAFIYTKSPTSVLRSLICMIIIHHAMQQIQEYIFLSINIFYC